ncbi:serine protease, partial [Streptomyces mangrovisoli]
MSAIVGRPPWLVSVRRAVDAAPEGAGLLCTPRHILTCAHVVAGKNVTAPPDGPVHVVFQFVDHEEPLPARVVAGGWHPAVGTQGDVAVLELDGPLPPGARPAPLRSTHHGVSDHRMHVYGYPKGHEHDGIPVVGDIVGHAEREWIQVQAGQVGWAMEGGFSGSPVFDQQAGGVVGMLVGRDTVTEKKDRRTAYAIHVEALAGYWPQLAPHIEDTPTAEVRSQLEDLLAVPLSEDGTIPRVEELDPLDIGVTPSKFSGRPEGAPYIARPGPDQELEAALEGSDFVLLVGLSKAGKSRTLYELLRRTMPRARLVVPKLDHAAPGDLSRLLPLPTASDPAVIWLDDLHHYLRPGGLDLKVLSRLRRAERKVVLVATLTLKRRDGLLAMEGDMGRTARSVLNRAKSVELPHLLGPEERRTAQQHYPDEDFSERGIGEQLVAAPVLENRLGGAFESCPPGWAVTKAAADWHRMGLEGPVPEAVLQRLFLAYMARSHPGADAGETEFRAGLRWAREAVAGRIALLERVGQSGAEHAYRAFPYIPEYLDVRAGVDPMAAVPEFAWAEAPGLTTPPGLLSVAYAALLHEQAEVAERLLAGVRAAARAAAGRALDGPPATPDDVTPDGTAPDDVTPGTASGVGSDSAPGTAAVPAEGPPPDPESAAWACLMLGQLQLYRGDFVGAVARFEEALESGGAAVVPYAQVDLAGVLMATDRDRARALLEEAAHSGDLLAVQLAQVELAGLLISEGDHEQAQLMLQTVLDSGDSEVAPIATTYMARAVSDEGDTAALQRPGKGQTRDSSLGRMPTDQPWSLSRSVGQAVSGQMVGALAKALYGGLYVSQGRLDDAEAMLRSVVDSNQFHAVALARAGLGEVLILKERFAEAREELEAVLASGHPLVAPVAQVSLGILLLQQGEADAGTGLLRAVAESDHPEQSARAAYVLGEWYLTDERFDPDAAAAWFGRTLAGGHPDWSGSAQIGLAALAFTRDDAAEAQRLLEGVVASGHRENGPRAAESLGVMLAGLGLAEEAESAYRTAIASGHPQWSLIARIDLAQLLSATDAPRARELLEGVVDSAHPEHMPQAADLLGDLLTRLGQPRDAETAYRRAVDSGHVRWSLVASVDLAVMLADHDRFDDAEVLLHQVVRSDNEMVVALAQALLGLVLIHTRRGADGVALLRTAAATDFPDVRQMARFYLAKELHDEGLEEEAGRLLESVIEDEPSDVTAVARAYLGVMKLRAGDEDAADALLTSAEDSGDQEAMAVAYLGTGKHLLEMGEIDTARELFDLALETNFADTAPEARAYLGVERCASNELAEAETLLAQALADGVPALEPMIRRYLGSALARQGKYAEARGVLEPLADSDDVEHRPEALHMLAWATWNQGLTEDSFRRFEQAIEAGDQEQQRQARRDYVPLLRSQGRMDRAQEITAQLEEERDQSEATDPSLAPPPVESPTPR